MFKGSLDPRHRELLILRTGWHCKAPYEWAQHVALATALGMSQASLEPELSESQLSELPILVGQYHLVAFATNVLRVPLDAQLDRPDFDPALKT
jgi:alkylhydroperoxidase family enzyme